MKEHRKEAGLFALVCFLLTISLMFFFLGGNINGWPLSYGISAFIAGYLTWSRLVAGRDKNRARQAVKAGCIVGIAIHFVQSFLLMFMAVIIDLFRNNLSSFSENFSLILLGPVAMGFFCLIATGIFTIPIAILTARIFAKKYTVGKKASKQE